MQNPFWHVCYVKPRFEKIVQKKLNELNFDSFLPVVNHLKVYKTAKKIIQLPLFTGYIFVNIEAGYRHHITALPEVYKFVKFREEYARVSYEEINNLKLLVSNVKDYNDIHTDVVFQKGVYVEITDGPFKGMTGRMAEKFGKNRLLIEVEALRQVISIDIETKYLKSTEISEISELEYC